MTPKDIVEIIVLVGGLGLTVFGAVYAALTGTTTVRRAKLTGDLMEQTINVKQKDNDGLRSQVTALAGKVEELTTKCSTLEEQVEQMTKQKELDTKAVDALTALAHSLGATPAQLKLALAGIVVTKAELDADPDLAHAIDKVVAHADKLTSPTITIKEGS